MTRREHAIGLLQAFFRQPGPLDLSLAAYFRAHPELGVRDRRVVRTLCYAVVRHRCLLEEEGGVEPAGQLAALVGLQGGEPDGAPGEEEACLADLQRRASTLPTPWQRHSLPSWLWQRLAGDRDEAQAEALATFLNGTAPLDLRPSRRRHTRQTWLERWQEAGFDCRATPWSPWGLRFPQPVSLEGHALFAEGACEVQDEGSQLIVPLLNPQSGQLLVDLCAGAGGKSLQMADLLDNRGEVIACDTALNRLQRLPPRARKSGLSIIHLLPLRHERDKKLLKLAQKADGVLVDAPCSASGTWRRHPDLKWRADPGEMAVFPLRQGALLAAGAQLVRPGGRLVYATCSVFAEENEKVVSSFLADYPEFSLVSVTKTLAGFGIVSLPNGEPFLRMVPHVTNTDGFFAALLMRASTRNRNR
ncbi:MAG: RsmB/NOP family class I SAM-dependent RNA methyltransferase [Magnetococcales bacterium]|nr:RsmB/NOP family class I SAM-dependent RNA methyltransferase [Magnetococcales bacterium]